MQYRFRITFQEIFHIKETWLNTPEMFQVKTGCELKLAAESDNANLILIWSHCHFKQKNAKVSFC